MKKLGFIVVNVFVFVVVAVGAFAVFDLNFPDRKLCEAGVYDMLNDELIELYEREIAGENVVTGKSQAQLERTANKLGVDVKKLKAIMLLQDFAAMTGRNISLSELAVTSDMKLLALFKQCGEEYLNTLPEARRAELKKMLSDAIKMPIKI